MTPAPVASPTPVPTTRWLRRNLDEQARSRVADVERVPLASASAPGGTPRMVTLGEIASVRSGPGSQQINRKAQLREILVTANVERRSAGDVARDVTEALGALSFPPGYRVSRQGSSQDMAESLHYAKQALLLAVVFIYLILTSQFGSFTQPLAIMASLPLSLIGVAIALPVCGSTLNIFSTIGFIMLMGLVTKNAILLVDFANKAIQAGATRMAALMEAGRVRLRPILMTTLAMVFGMLPLALGLGEGGEQRAPMGQAVIGGVIASPLLTLLVVPVLYSYLDAFGAWSRGRLAKRSTAAPLAQGDLEQGARLK